MTYYTLSWQYCQIVYTNMGARAKEAGLPRLLQSLAVTKNCHPELENRYINDNCLSFIGSEPKAMSQRDRWRKEL